MGVPLQRFVPRDSRDLHRVQDFLEKPAGCFVPEIVKMNIGQKGRVLLLFFSFTFLLIGSPGEGDGTGKRDGDGSKMYSPNFAVDPPDKFGQDTDGVERGKIRFSPFFISRRVTVRSSDPALLFGGVV